MVLALRGPVYTYEVSLAPKRALEHSGQLLYLWGVGVGPDALLAALETELEKIVDDVKEKLDFVAEDDGIAESFIIIASPEAG